MLKELKYKELAQLGINVWMPRVDTHPHYVDAKIANIVPETIRINAKCLILLYSEHKPLLLDPEAKKIYTGMIGVLQLKAIEMMTAVVYAVDPKYLDMQIEQWNPEYILQLDKNFPALNRDNCIQTFSPNYLLQNPKYKAQAYKDLLNLRTKIHDGA